MLEAARRVVLCERGAPDLTGLDFVTVLDATSQDVLRVFFIVDPTLVDDPANPGSSFADALAPFPQPANPGLVRIEPAPAHDGAPEIEITGARWVRDAASGRTALEIEIASPGDFSRYVLTMESEAADRFFRSLEFSFKQGCPSPFDCKSVGSCPPEEGRDVAVDYLARDFDSYRLSLLDFAAEHYPDWRERVPADAAVMLSEVMAALADELAYTQDRYFAQGFLETATHPRALSHLARLVDYRRDPGSSAQATLALVLRESGAAGVGAELDYSDRRIPVWAAPEGMDPVPFELGEGLGAAGELEEVQNERDRLLWMHSHWNAMPLYVPDPSEPCLEIGATEAFLAPVTLADGSVFNRSPLTGALRPGSTLAEEEFWIGRQMVLRSRPADPSTPARAWAVTVREVEITRDPLAIDLGGPLVVTRVRWDESEALPFQLPKAETRLLGNVAPATAGRTLCERFRVGPDDAVAPALRGVPRAVEREGPLDETTGLRTVAVSHGLLGTERRDLAWSRRGLPELRLLEMTPNPIAWSYRETLLEGDEQTRFFTLEPGLWKTILRYERSGEVTLHADYASPNGFTIRLGDGFFGRRPEPGDLFAVTYRVHPGPDANLPADSVTRLRDPADPDAVPHPALADVTAATNPFPTSGARFAESVEHTRIFAPEAYKARPLRAVVDEDYRAILGRLSWVQQAGAPARFTGSWLTRFATADPRQATGLSEEHVFALQNAVDCIRQAGREVHVVQPKYAPIDLRVTICVKEGFFGGQVRAAVVEAVSDRRGGFFDPDRFSFGDPLRRSELEAAIQCVPGVLGVERIEYRRRGMTDWSPFVAPQLEVAPFEIVQLRNDPRFPAQGSIQVQLHGAGAGAGP